MDVKREIELLKERFSILGVGTDHGLFYDLLQEMSRTMLGQTEDGKHLYTDEEWKDYFNEQFMSREEFIQKKEEL